MCVSVASAAMSASDAVRDVVMGFLPLSYAVPDAAHPGLMRAGERTGAPYGGESVESRPCRAIDLAASGAPSPDLLTMGFDVVDLASFDELQDVLGRVAAAGRVGDNDAARIRAALDGATLSCVGGCTLKVLHLAGEGLFMRTGGPNRLPVVPPESNGMNDHGAATSVHVDQDVYGTPLSQVMGGRAPELFRHDSPDGNNHDASLMLVNLWIPLHQVTQPLVLADGRSVDRRRHQLRYGLSTGSFLERDDEMAINDIWTMLHDPGQQWYFRSDMDHRSAYVFDTLSTPHGAGVLVGEELAERASVGLEAAEAAATVGDAAGVAHALAGIDVRTADVVGVTDSLGRALDRLAAAVDEARSDPEGVCDPSRRDEWLTRSQSARRNVVRTSIELRVVVSVDR